MFCCIELAEFEYVAYVQVSKVSHVLSVGKHIILKCIKKDSQGMVEFSLKALEEAPEVPSFRIDWYI